MGGKAATGRGPPPAQVSFDVVVQVKPGLPGWQFAWKRFTPDTKHVRIRLVQAGTVRAGEPAFSDGVGLTPPENGKSTMITSCPNCYARFNAPDDAAGQMAKCPRCGTHWLLQGAGPN